MVDTRPHRILSNSSHLSEPLIIFQVVLEQSKKLIDSAKMKVQGLFYKADVYWRYEINVFSFNSALNYVINDFRKF